MAEVDELGEGDRLDLANAMASARLEGQEVTPATEALAVEFLAGRLDAETFRRRVLDAAMDTAPARRR